MTTLRGRIYEVRDLGGILFFTLRDATDTIQIRVHGTELIDQYRSVISQGNIVTVHGEPFYNRRNQLLLNAQTIELLREGCLPLLSTDAGFNRRHRESDMVSNLATLRLMQRRSLTIQQIRTFLYEQNFTEVETPILQRQYGGAEATPFTTHGNATNQDYFLRIAPELYLKRAVVAGMDNVFELGRVFRNEGVDRTHSPEFTSLEVYQAYGDYQTMMALTQTLIQSLTTEQIQWQTMTMVESVEQYTGYDFNHLSEDEAIALGCGNNWGAALLNLFETHVEPNLTQPTFITQFPVESSPLAMITQNDPRFADRFELYVNGMELANGYSELNNPIIQRERMELLGNLDPDYISALEVGLPPTGGVGIGVDRLIMWLTNTEQIRDVILFN